MNYSTSLEETLILGQVQLAAIQSGPSVPGNEFHCFSSPKGYRAQELQSRPNLVPDLDQQTDELLNFAKNGSVKESHTMLGYEVRRRGVGSRGEV